MSTEVIKHTYQLKRGTAKDWAALNPILRQGEPGFEYDTNKLKIGDGFTYWNALPYISGESGIVKVDTKNDLPSIGQNNVLYIISDTLELYQWNDIKREYECLSTSSGSVSEEVITESDFVIMDCGDSQQF